ncbi:MAG TPA: helix-turn-helix transcriptional regulator [Phenylobacterium sp.]|nr:helix-turn-helix transcriptional regulator [Phenylobacterium sp.]
MNDIAEILKQRIMQRLVDLKLTPITAATKAGLPRDTLRNFFRQDRSVPRADTLSKIAAALETSVGFLLGEVAFPSDRELPAERSENAFVRVRPIHVRASAATGYVSTSDALEESLDVIYLHVPGFEYAKLRALEIGDDSMNLYYDEGSYVVFSIADVTGVREGDHIVTGITRENGTEFLVRELTYEGDDAVAAPASLSSEYPKLAFGSEDAGDMAVIGVVVAQVNFRMRPFGSSRFPSVENNDAWWVDDPDDGA